MIGNPEYIIACSDVSEESLENIAELTQKVLPWGCEPLERMRIGLSTLLLETILPCVNSLKYRRIDWNGLANDLQNTAELSKWVSLPIFNCELLFVYKELRDYRLKGFVTKLETFQAIPQQMKVISTESLQKYILPLALNIDFFAEAGVPDIFHFFSSLPFPIISTSVIPFLTSLLSSERLEVRLNLLQCMPSFITVLDFAFISDVFLPNVRRFSDY
jgi:hypothetical protein